MKYYLTQLFLLFFLLNSIISNCQTEPEYADEQNWAKRISYSGSTFDVYVVDTKKNKLIFYWKNSKNKLYKSIESLKTDLETQNKELIFATNAGIYSLSYAPVGLFVENGVEKTPVKFCGDDTNFCMNFGDEKKTNGIFIVDSTTLTTVIKAKDYNAYKKNVLYATQSGPLLVFHSEINPKFKKGSVNTNIRSGVGIINSTKVVFAISNESVNFYDFASLFKDYFGCTDAMYFDGAISQMYLPALNRMESDGYFGGLIGIVK